MIFTLDYTGKQSYKQKLKNSITQIFIIAVRRICGYSPNELFNGDDTLFKDEVSKKWQSQKLTRIQYFMKI